jgi:hypothetical protein
MHSAVPGFICATGNSVIIFSPRRRCLSISTTHAIWTWDRGARKIIGLKDFEVHGNLEKELGFNRQDSAIQSAQLFAQSIKNGIAMITRSCYQ